MERALRAEKERLGKEAAQQTVWMESPFNQTSAIVGVPTGRFANLVTEVLPLIPRRLWRKAFVGQSPDGLTRVTIEWSRKHGEYLPSHAAMRQARRCSGHKVYFVDARKASDDFIVVLQDGRAGYTGSLDILRAAVIQSIASQEVYPANFLDRRRIGEWHTGD